MDDTSEINLTPLKKDDSFDALDVEIQKFKSEKIKKKQYRRTSILGHLQAKLDFNAFSKNSAKFNFEKTSKNKKTKVRFLSVVNNKINFLENSNSQSEKNCSKNRSLENNNNRNKNSSYSLSLKKNYCNLNDACFKNVFDYFAKKENKKIGNFNDSEFSSLYDQVLNDDNNNFKFYSKFMNTKNSLLKA